MTTTIDASDSAPPAPSAAPPWPNSGYAWFVVFLLVLAFTSSFIDRQIVSLLVAPIRADLNITDTQFSLLVGLAFSLFYSFVGLPIAYAADRMSRRWIITIGVFAWSVMTCACGLASNFWQLFLARMGVGIGEATLTPSASSLISDYFPKHRRGLAMAVYATGVYWGSGLALMIGGLVVRAVESSPPLVLPLVGELRAWQTVFFIVGLPGILLALAMLLIKEPVRRGLAAAAAAPATAAPDAALSSPKLTPVLPFLRKNLLAVASIFLGFTMLGMVVIAYLTWIPAIFMRTYGWDAAQVGLAFGAIVILFGTGGILAGGLLTDWLTKRGRTDAAVRAGLYGGVLTVPLAIIAPLLPTPELVMGGVALALFAATSTQALPVVAIQFMSPNNLRARMAAIYFMVGSLLIFTGGPTAVALATDYVFKDDLAVRYSLSLACGLFAPIGVLLMIVALGPYRRSVAAAAAWD
jgi:MFS family permease